jgi:hypothetical protein
VDRDAHEDIGHDADELFSAVVVFLFDKPILTERTKPLCGVVVDANSIPFFTGDFHRETSLIKINIKLRNQSRQNELTATAAGKTAQQIIAVARDRGQTHRTNLGGRTAIRALKLIHNINLTFYEQYTTLLDICQYLFIKKN